jgi:hypothetical protein
LSGWIIQRQKFAYRLLIIAPLLALPGTAEIGTTALGTSAAVLLMVLVSLIWTAEQQPGIGRIVACGILFGLSAGSRFELVLFAPALLMVEFLRAHCEKLSFKTVLPALAMIAIGFALFAINQFLPLLATEPALAVRGQKSYNELLQATGIQFSSPNFLTGSLNRISRAIGFLPPFLIIISLASFVWPTGSANSDPGSMHSRRFRCLLYAAGLVLFAAWTLRAPIPYLRYLWPSLACFAIMWGFLIMQILSAALETKEWQKVVFCQAIALVLIMTGVAGTTRSIVMGESDYASWEWAGQMPKDRFAAFQHFQDQSAAFNFVRDELPADSVIMSYFPYPLRYKTGRPILDANVQLPKIMTSKKYYLVLTPMVGPFLFIRPQTYGWIEENADLLRQFGRYSVYELRTLPSSEPDILRAPWGGYDGHPLSRRWF